MCLTLPIQWLCFKTAVTRIRKGAEIDRYLITVVSFKRNCTAVFPQFPRSRWKAAFNETLQRSVIFSQMGIYKSESIASIPRAFFVFRVALTPRFFLVFEKLTKNCKLDKLASRLISSDVKITWILEIRANFIFQGFTFKAKKGGIGELWAHCVRMRFSMGWWLLRLVVKIFVILWRTINIILVLTRKFFCRLNFHTTNG